MARPGANAARKRHRAAMEAEEEDEQERLPRLQALPVADLPEGFDGEAEDGATYLALANRSNAALPTFTSVPNPYRRRTPTPPIRAYTPSAPLIDGQPVAAAGPSRHPALPTKEWGSCFAAHFVNYRKHLAGRWPPSPPLSYPADWPHLPQHVHQYEWPLFINGYPRRRFTPAELAQAGKQAQREVVATTEVSEEMTSEGPTVATVAMDEEEMMNAPTPGLADEEEGLNIGLEANNAAPISTDRLVVGSDGKVLEPEGPRHRPREPLVSALQNFTTDQIVAILSHLTYHITTSLTDLDSSLLATQPASPSLSDLSDLSSSSGFDDPKKHTQWDGPSPLPARLTRWIFALLLVLDPDLGGDQVSVLRELARAAMRAGGWRWIVAVQSGEVVSVQGDGEGDRDRDREGGGAAVGGAQKRETGWALGKQWSDELKTRIQRDRGFSAGSTLNGINVGASSSAAAPGQATRTTFANTRADVLSDIGGRRRVFGPRSVPVPGEAGEVDIEENGIDETLARCWLIVHSVAAGWGQRDLLEDLEDMFR